MAILEPNNDIKTIQASISTKSNFAIRDEIKLNQHMGLA